MTAVGYPQAPQPDPGLARAAAIAASGRCAGFHFIAPRNFCWWVYIVLVGYGVLTAIAMLGQPLSVFGPAISGAIALLLIYGLVLWWFTRTIDRYSPVPGKLIVTALMWGAFAATMTIAVHANTALISLYAKVFGQKFAQNWAAGLSAPITEEVAKGIGIVLLIYMAPKVIRTAFDGFIVGAFIGLGFQTLENILYSMNVATSEFGLNAGELALQNALLRMVSGVSGHIVNTAIFCAGVVYLMGRPGEPRNVKRGIGLMVLPIAMHWFFNSLQALFPVPGAWFLIVLLLAVALFVTITVMVYRLVVVREQMLLRAILAPEVTIGVLTPPELDAIAGTAKQRRALRKSLPDHAARRRQRWVVEAASDLANALARSGGADTPEVAFARSEVWRVRTGMPAARL